MDAQHRKNLRRAADFCRDMRHEALAEACSRADAEIDRLRAALDLAARTLRGETTQDQGEAYDQAQRIIDAALGEPSRSCALGCNGCDDCTDYEPR